MSIRRLRYFISVAEHLNFTKAAEEYYLAQSAISQQISRLEDEIGVKLFIRDNKTTSLTPAGELFYNDVKIILKKYDNAIEKLQNLNNGYFYELNIAYNCQYERVFLPPIIKEFTDKFPNIQINVHSCPLSRIKLELEHGIADLAYIFPYEFTNSNIFEIRPLFIDVLYVAMNKSHKLANKNNITFEDLKNETIIMVKEGDIPANFKRMKEDFRAYNFTPKKIQEVQDFDTMLLMVEADHGITFVPSNIKKNASINLKLFPIEIKDKHFTHEIAAVYLKGNENNLVKHFVDTAINYFNNLCKTNPDSYGLFCSLILKGDLGA